MPLILTQPNPLQVLVLVLSENFGRAAVLMQMICAEDAAKVVEKLRVRVPSGRRWGGVGLKMVMIKVAM